MKYLFYLFSSLSLSPILWVFSGVIFISPAKGQSPNHSPKIINIVPSTNARFVNMDIVSFLAGTGAAGYSGDGGPATEAQFNRVRGIAFDKQGNLFVADSFNGCIRKIDTAGIITTIAGTGTRGFSGDGGPATEAELITPNYIIVDTLGNVFFSDLGTHRVRKIDTMGIITTIAGSGGTGYENAGYGGDGGPATEARLAGPQGLAIDAESNLLIADSYNNRIRKVNTDGIITTIAGNGIGGYSDRDIGDNGPANDALIGNPDGLTIDAEGNLLIADTGHNRIRKINTNGIITTIAGNGAYGYSGDHGPATEASLDLRGRITLDAYGNLFFTDNHYYIRKIGVNGIITTIAGSNEGYMADNMPARSTYFFPFGVTMDSQGNLIVTAAHQILKIKLNTELFIEEMLKVGVMVGTLSAVDPDGDTLTFSITEGNVNNAFAIDSAGYITVANAQALDYETTDKFTLTVAVSDGIDTVSYPVNILLINQPEKPVIESIRPGDHISLQVEDIITTVAGTGIAGYSGDGGPATEAQLSSPGGIAIDEQGNLFIVDTDNDRIRKVDTHGIITTVAGTGTKGYSGDGGPAINAQFNSPTKVTVDTKGNLFIADAFYYRIRKVDTNGIITAVAGTGTKGYSGDGGPAINAHISEKVDMATDTRGNLYIADAGNHRVRKVDTEGIITTIAGNGNGLLKNVLDLMEEFRTPEFALDAKLEAPQGIEVDEKGNFYFTDSYPSFVQKVDATGKMFNLIKGEYEYYQDFLFNCVAFCHPKDLAIDAQGNLYIIYGQHIKKRDRYRGIFTLVGADTAGYGGDGGPAVAATLNSPIEIEVDHQDNLLIADQGNHRIRKVTTERRLLLHEMPEAGKIIAFIRAEDPAEKTLSYSIIKGNEKGAFGINESGELTLINAEALDFENFDSLSLTVQVSNGIFTDQRTLIIARPGVLAVEDLLDENILFYPNPTTGEMNLEVNYRWVGGQLKVTNALGATITSSQITSTKMYLNMEAIKAGFYIVTLQKGMHAKTFKVIKQ